jgi:hypothetical protein
MSAKPTPTPLPTDEHKSGKLLIDLRGFLADVACSVCGQVRSASDFLKTWTVADKTVWLSGDSRRVCNTCEPPPRPFPLRSGMQVRGLVDASGASLTWRERNLDRPFGPALPLEKMGLRIMRPGENVVKPQPKRYGSGRRLSAAERAAPELPGLDDDDAVATETPSPVSVPFSQVGERVLLLPVGEIDDNPVQPHRRVQATALEELRLNLMASQLMLPIAVMKNPKHPARWVNIDGHRRLALARSMGLRHVQCVEVTAGAPSTLFMHLNGGQRAFKGNDWLAIWSKGNTPKERLGLLQHIGRKARAQVAAVVDFYGEERSVELGRIGKQAPFISKACQNCLNVLVQHEMKPVLQKRTIGEWLIKHNTQMWINAAMREGKGGKASFARLLHKYISNDATPPGVKTRALKIVSRRNVG